MAYEQQPRNIEDVYTQALKEQPPQIPGSKISQLRAALEANLRNIGIVEAQGDFEIPPLPLTKQNGSDEFS